MVFDLQGRQGAGFAGAGFSGVISEAIISPQSPPFLLSQVLLSQVLLSQATTLPMPAGGVGAEAMMQALSGLRAPDLLKLLAELRGLIAAGASTAGASTAGASAANLAQVASRFAVPVAALTIMVQVLQAINAATQAAGQGGEGAPTLPPLKDLLVQASVSADAYTRASSQQQGLLRDVLYDAAALYAAGGLSVEAYQGVMQQAGQSFLSQLPQAAPVQQAVPVQQAAPVQRTLPLLSDDQLLNDALQAYADNPFGFHALKSVLTQMAQQQGLSGAELASALVNLGRNPALLAQYQSAALPQMMRLFVAGYEGLTARQQEALAGALYARFGQAVEAGDYQGAAPLTAASQFLSALNTSPNVWQSVLRSAGLAPAQGQGQGQGQASAPAAQASAAAPAEPNPPAASPFVEIPTDEERRSLGQDPTGLRRDLPADHTTPEQDQAAARREGEAAQRELEGTLGTTPPFDDTHALPPQTHTGTSQQEAAENDVTQDRWVFPPAADLIRIAAGAGVYVEPDGSKLILPDGRTIETGLTFDILELQRIADSERAALENTNRDYLYGLPPDAKISYGAAKFYGHILSLDGPENKIEANARDIISQNGTAEYPHEFYSNTNLGLVLPGLSSEYFSAFDRHSDAHLNARRSLEFASHSQHVLFERPDGFGESSPYGQLAPLNMNVVDFIQNPSEAIDQVIEKQRFLINIYFSSLFMPNRGQSFRIIEDIVSAIKYNPHDSSELEYIYTYGYFYYDSDKEFISRITNRLFENFQGRDFSDEENAYIDGSSDAYQRSIDYSTIPHLSIAELRVALHATEKVEQYFSLEHQYFQYLRAAALMQAGPSGKIQEIFSDTSKPASELTRQAIELEWATLMPSRNELDALIEKLDTPERRALYTEAYNRLMKPTIDKIEASRAAAQAELNQLQNQQAAPMP
jgi:hypothetical protein